MNKDFKRLMKKQASDNEILSDISSVLSDLTSSDVFDIEIYDIVKELQKMYEDGINNDPDADEPNQVNTTDISGKIKDVIMEYIIDTLRRNNKKISDRVYDILDEAYYG